MIGPTRYYSNLPRRPRCRPADGLPAAGVLADPAAPRSIIGIAYPHSHVGGFRPDDDPATAAAPPEVVWRLVIDRAWSDAGLIHLADKVTPEGRFVLRDGEFIELAEEVD